MSLPINVYKDKIISTVLASAFTIVLAETGTGKSTQVPQMISKYYKQVVVTEPRVMAAKTLAMRIAEETGKTLGEEVGYKTAYDKCAKEDSNILFCTDGLQLIRTIFSKDTLSENVLIIDELHEWNNNMEELVAWSKFMYQKWNTKVVLMSATLDAEKLSRFYGKDVSTVYVPGRTYDVTVQERTSWQFVDTIKEKIAENKNILVFVPGKKEIDETIRELKNENATVLPLHGELDWEDQKKCFASYNNPKVIVSTNIAQTSLTIPDIDVVVDTGVARVKRAVNGVEGLHIEHISQAEIEQRKGRAGRTKNGEYILCSDCPISQRPEYPTPEIQRSLLDKTVLQMASVGLDAETIEFFHQPKKEEIIRAKEELKLYGALDSEGRTTKIGEKMVRIPVSAKLARMIVEAEKYGVTEQVITISAIVEMGGLLAKGGSYCEYTKECDSDLLAELDVWNKINSIKNIDFKEMRINKKAFFRIKEHIKKLKEALHGSIEMQSANDRDGIVKACISGLRSNIYVNQWRDLFDKEGNRRVLNNRSCLMATFERPIKIIVGIPYTLEGKYGEFDVVSFASKIDFKTLLEIAPDSLMTETEEEFEPYKKAVKVVTRKYFGYMLVDSSEELYYDHPMYEKLKREFEAQNPYPRQNEIEINYRVYEVYYDYQGKPSVYVYTDELMEMEEDRVCLANGETVKIIVTGRLNQFSSYSIRELKSLIKQNDIREKTVMLRNNYSKLQAKKLRDVIMHKDKIGAITQEFKYSAPTTVYGYVYLKKGMVIFGITEFEDEAKDETQQVLLHLFKAEVEDKYRPGVFSHAKGKKRKVLTNAEMELKADFDAFVKDVTSELTLENAEESLKMLEEYYQELMNA